MVRHDTRASATERLTGLLQHRDPPTDLAQGAGRRQAPHGTANDQGMRLTHAPPAYNANL